MIYDTSNRCANSGHTLTPIYIGSTKFTELQKEGLAAVAKYIAVNSRAAEASLLKNCVSIATTDHSPPAYQAPSQSILSIVNTASSSSRSTSILERAALDLDSRFSKPELKRMAIKAAHDFLAALVPDATIGAVSAVDEFQAKMQEISVRMDKFKTSTLYAGIESDIEAALCKMAIQKFAGTSLNVNAACFEKVRKVMELANEQASDASCSLSGRTCKQLAQQTLGIFQEEHFAHLKAQSKNAVDKLLGASKPGSKISIAIASVNFNENIKDISAQRVHLKDHDLHGNFAEKIQESINESANDFYFTNCNHKNRADWIAIKNALSQGKDTIPFKNFPTDLHSAQALLGFHLAWMNDKEFLDQVKGAFKEYFTVRYERSVLRESQEGINERTKIVISASKKYIIANCTGKTEQDIATIIQSVREELVKLLMAGDSGSYSIPRSISLNFFTKAVENYLESNAMALDLAISGIIIDHLEIIRSRRLLYQSYS